MTRVLRLLPLAALLSACAMAPPAPPAPPPPPPAPVPQFVVPEGTEFVSDLFGYSQAVRVGPWVTTSAIPGFDIEKRGFPESYPEQVQAGFANLKRVLEAAGASMDEVVEITTYQLDMEKFNDTIDGKNEAFGERRPTWTSVGAKSLPLPSMQFQVSARAWSPKGKVVVILGEQGTPAAAPVAPAPAAAAPAPAAAVKPEEPKKKDTAPPRFMNRPGY
ncbi:enamine deaminase RidA (YjgF/YER057c/UK114 family) [Panacagrimonas perspica]|uniref:Enamine deaminase RidA (YjgF/YER057c/UK114 family) n=1 Tax=Panacagrimonas perspica TaxID=381431 RepID=A0A4S3K8G7_9GAMM|nr:Rid family hydrolase [Panacagrimonas perspica]TDU24146.1 enamine deaminase RidA (YjgF/YER057c/UK114 family) [Panacagrimonas perspica]THD04562.1 hypothetical protein B1810_03840 [Panacagrimonas perspica]